MLALAESSRGGAGEVVPPPTAGGTAVMTSVLVLRDPGAERDKEDDHHCWSREEPEE